jgi:hypothetical protein
MPTKTRTIDHHKKIAEDLLNLRKEVSNLIGNYGYLFKVRDQARVCMMNIQAQVERLRVVLDEEYKTLSSENPHIYFPSREPIVENNQSVS